MNILMSLMMLSMAFVMLTMSTASAERICEVFEGGADLVNPEHPVHTIADGSVEFRHVDFAYRKTPTSRSQDINLSVRSGETIGIIGGTGSAKTSLVSLISRLYDVTAGQVLVGGRDVRGIRPGSLRDQVSVVLRKTSSSPAPFWRICAGATRTPLWRNANGPAGWPAPMSSSKRCPMAMIPTWNKGAPTSPAGSVSGCASPGPC